MTNAYLIQFGGAQNVHVHIYIYRESKLGPQIAFFESKLGPSFLLFFQKSSSFCRENEIKENEQKRGTFFF